MIHTFNCLDKYFLLDVDTCSLFEIDKMTSDLCHYIDKGLDYGELYNIYDKVELDECASELLQIKTEGIAFTNKDWKEFKDKPVSHDLKAMCLHVSHDCELRCKYCFAATGSFHGKRDLMTYETGIKALEFLAKNSGQRNNLEVDFFGGEPLLNFENVKKIIEYGKNVVEKKYNKSFRFTITTNGLALNDEILNDFKEMYNVVISIDGRKEVHDNMRPDLNGNATYDIILENGKKLKKSREDKSYYVRGTYTSQNLDFSKDVLHLADAGFDQISMEPVVLDEKTKYAIKEEHIDSLCKEYEILAKEYIERRKNDEKWFNFFHFMIDMNSGPCISKRLTGCGAGNEYISITPNGDVYPCHQFVGNKKYIMGNINDDTFNRDMQKTFSTNHVLNKDECNDCWCKFFCSGGCIANAVAFNGDMFSPHKISCELQKKRTECGLAIYSIEKDNKEKNPLNN